MTEQNNNAKTELSFSIYEVIPLMAKAYAIEASEPIIKATTSASKGIFKKYKINSERIDNTYFDKLSLSVVKRLQEAFQSELELRFEENDTITLIFSNNVLSLSLGSTYVSTDDFRILFNTLFVDKLNTNINLNNEMCIECDNSTLLEAIAGDIYDISKIDIYQILQSIEQGSETSNITIFCFQKEDLEKPENLVKKFKFLKNLRKH